MLNDTVLLVATFEEYDRRKDAAGERSVKKQFWRELYALVKEGEDEQKITYETFTGCFYGEWPKHGRNLIVVLLGRLIAKWEMTPDEVISSSHAEEVVHQNHDEIDDVYSGAWLTVQYRTKTESPAKRFPPSQLRIGLLIYGQDDEERRRFTEIGVKTIWSGDLYKQGDYLYYRSYERSSSSSIYEKMNFIMKAVREHSTTKFHFGIRVGTAFEEFSDPLIFASPLLLWKIPEWNATAAPLNKTKVDELRKYCSYIPLDPNRSTDQFGDLAEQVKNAVELFKKLTDRDGRAVEPIFIP